MGMVKSFRLNLIPKNDKKPSPLSLSIKTQGLTILRFLRPNDSLKIRITPNRVNGFLNFFSTIGRISVFTWVAVG
jgi:hypothetical protein